jgi:hypothetical protein
MYMCKELILRPFQILQNASQDNEARKINPWSPLRYLIGEMQYAGALESVWDKRILTAYIDKYYQAVSRFFACVCVCVCARARVRACVYVCVCVCARARAIKRRSDYL